MTTDTAEQTKKRVQERDYKQSRSTYLQDRIKQLQEQLKETGLETNKRLALQKSLKSMKDNLSKIKSQSSVTNPIKEISNMSNVKKRAIEQATASLEELAAPLRTGGGMSKGTQSKKNTSYNRGADSHEDEDEDVTRSGMRRPGSAGKPKKRGGGARGSMTSDQEDNDESYEDEVSRRNDELYDERKAQEHMERNLGGRGAKSTNRKGPTKGTSSRTRTSNPKLGARSRQDEDSDEDDYSGDAPVLNAQEQKVQDQVDELMNEMLGKNEATIRAKLKKVKALLKTLPEDSLTKLADLGMTEEGVENSANFYAKPSTGTKPKAAPAKSKPADDAEIQDKAPRKTATKKTNSAPAARNSKAAKDAEIKAITDLENKFNNNLKASGPRDPKVKDLHKKLVERKEKFNDTYKSAKPFYYIAEPVKRGSTPLDKLKSLYLEIENTRNDKTRERLVKQADSIEKKLSPADAKAAKRLLEANDKSRKDELNEKISSKSKWDKVADIKKYAKQLNATTDASKKTKLSNTIAELYGSLTAAERKTVALNTIVSKRDMKLMAGHDKAVEKLFNNPATSFYTPGQIKLNFAKDQKASSVKAPAKADSLKDANGKRYTKRGVTKMINELKDANERGRKTSAAYKKREEDIKRLSKILKTLTTTASVSASDAFFLDNVVTAGIETDVSDIAQATGLILGIRYRDFQDRNEFYQIVPEAGESRRVELREVEDVVDTLDEYGIKDAIIVDKKSPRASVSFDATLNNKTYRVVLESSKGTLRITGQYD